MMLLPAICDTTRAERARYARAWSNHTRRNVGVLAAWERRNGVTLASGPVIALPSGGVARNSVTCCDALDLLRSLPSGSVDLIATDPPYFGVKDDDWDNQWKTADEFIGWLKLHLIEMRRALKPNGSLYLFASPRLAARVELAVSEFFNVLNSIRWIKDAGWHKKNNKEELRGYLQPWEAVIFAEQFASDNKYATMEYEINGIAYTALKSWFRARADKFDISLQQMNTALGAATNGGGLASGYFGAKVEFQLPTQARYEQMQSAFPSAFNRPYSSLRVEYEAARVEYEELRRPFFITPADPYTDVWTFKTVNVYPGKHPCEKPLDMLRHIVRASSRPGALVCDPFCGSGAILDAARREGRDYVGCDADPHWSSYATRRLSTPYALPLFTVDVTATFAPPAPVTTMALPFGAEAT